MRFFLASRLASARLENFFAPCSRANCGGTDNIPLIAKMKRMRAVRAAILYLVISAIYFLFSRFSVPLIHRQSRVRKHRSREHRLYPPSGNNLRLSCVVSIFIMRLPVHEPHSRARSAQLRVAPLWRTNKFRTCHSDCRVVRIHAFLA